MTEATGRRESDRARRRDGLALVAVSAAAVFVTLGLTGLAVPVAAAGGALAVILVAYLAQRWSRTVQTEAAAAAETPRKTPPFDAMLEHIPDPLLLVSGGDPGDQGDRRFQFANAAARDMLRLQRSEGPLTTAIRAPEVLAAVEKALFGDGDTEATWQTRGVQERHWRARLRRLTPADDASSPRLALLTLRDETEIRRIEATRADFLANASHELRTPLASLAGFVETLRGHAKDDEGARERFLAIMQVQAERMRLLIEDLMSLSRIELGEHIRPSDQVEVSGLVTDVIDALAPQATARQVRIVVEKDESGAKPVAIADRDQLVQVAQNLIENAIKYTPTGGTVTVEIGQGFDAIAAAAPVDPGSAHLPLLTPEPIPGNRFVRLRVRDSGPGIARNHLPRLAERFYRVEGQKSAGTGLGLAIVKHIVNRHRGGMVVESTVGAGSIFTVYVPLAERAPPDPARAAAMAEG